MNSTIHRGILMLGLGLGASLHATAQTIIDHGFGPYSFTGAGATEFSGLTYRTGNQYTAITDSGDTRFYDLSINIDNMTGQVQSASIGNNVQLDTSFAGDTEAVRYLANGNFLVGDEWDLTITTGNDRFFNTALREYDSAGNHVQTISTPASYQPITFNAGFEGVAVSADGQQVWAINEGATAADGPNSTPSVGEYLRLQAFDGNYNAGVQYAYQTEADPFGFGRNGVAELLATPDGGLIALERIQLNDSEDSFSIKLFAIDLVGASDVSHLGGLDGATFTTVTKSLLWETISDTNIEGMSLGPRLANGNHSLLLLSEGNGSFDPELRSLQLTAVPLPAAGWLFAGAIAGLIARQRLSKSGTQKTSAPA